MRAIIKADPLSTTQEIAKELNVNHTMVVRHFRKIGKVEKLDKWVPHELTKIKKQKQKNIVLSVVFSCSVQQ